jgi:hypothetical protein
VNGRNKKGCGKHQQTDFKKASLHFPSVELVSLKCNEKGEKSCPLFCTLTLHIKPKTKQ